MKISKPVKIIGGVVLGYGAVVALAMYRANAPFTLSVYGNWLAEPAYAFQVALRGQAAVDEAQAAAQNAQASGAGT